MSKTAFVTGGTGFLGFHVIQELLAQGWEVTALYRPSSNLTRLNGLGLSLVSGSISDASSFKDTMPENLDDVFHVAGNTNLWKKRNKEQFEDNVIGTRNMVEVALSKRAKKLIQTSSITAFGIHETRVNEETKSNALNCSVNYHKTKYQGELEVFKGVERGLDACILNPNHILGAYDAKNWAQLILLRAENKLPGIPPGVGMFGHATQIAKAHVKAGEVGRTGHRYLLGGIESNFLQVINVIEKQLGLPISSKQTPKVALILMVQLGRMQSLWSAKELKITPEKYALLTEYAICDDSKAQKELGYKHDSIEEMIEATIGWLREEGLLKH